ncbi:MAG: JAB domain-containing protein [Bacteroidota bacterium]
MNQYPSYNSSHQQREILFPSRIAEIRVSYSRNGKLPDVQRHKVSSSEDAADAFRLKWKKGQLQYCEQFKIMLLDRSNRILGIHTLSTGGQSGTCADPKHIFAVALKANSASIVLCHNHPSSNLKPSEADCQLTRKLKEAGKFLDLPILDHIILTQDAYFSFADDGIL